MAPFSCQTVIGVGLVMLVMISTWWVERKTRGARSVLRDLSKMSQFQKIVENTQGLGGHHGAMPVEPIW